MINWHPGLTLEEVEKQVIEMALRYFNNNKTQTAIALGIAVRTLDNKLEKYAGVAPEPEVPPVKIKPMQGEGVTTEKIEKIETEKPEKKVVVQSGRQPGKMSETFKK